MTAFVFRFYRWYPTSPFIDNLLDFFGMIILLTGTYVRMGSRGYKKAYSGRGAELVMGGPYSLVRNPMYLGTFLMGTGFILILWPWWSLPIFAGLFYLRFQRQIAKEEAHLSKLFGKNYQEYLQKTSPMFPDIKKLRKMKINEIFPWKLAWTTKEKYALLVWPAIALFLQIIQEKLLGTHTDLSESISVLILAMITFALGLWWEYSRA